MKQAHVSKVHCVFLFIKTVMIKTAYITAFITFLHSSASIIAGFMMPDIKRWSSESCVCVLTVIYLGFCLDCNDVCQRRRNWRLICLFPSSVLNTKEAAGLSWPYCVYWSPSRFRNHRDRGVTSLRSFRE